jgi:SpoVK/Ycf46/Vps4 family AAA+-type ATPase
VFVCSAAQPAVPHALALRVDKPVPEEQQRLWRQALQTGPGDTLPQRLATQFRFGAREIAEHAASPQATHSLWQRCREAARPRLEALAQRVTSSATWADLVLPDTARQTLRLIAAQLQHRHRVHTDWGFAERSGRGLGLSALFFGDSGVGKTLACEVLANELQLDLYRIDLSAVVSKYIGETEKNLRSVFDGAEDTGAILLFDEADALFGKRSEVKDSHDRYANIEVGYLLQRMEAYRGLAVLTTNQRAALDAAFLRRLRFVVNFPFPDQAQRERIWRCSFPAALPRGEIDFAKLAKLPLAGGAINNIVLNAAFFAAADDAPVQMQHLAQAAQLEAAKQERPGADSQTRGWA